jgi:hypothetical protein
MERDRLHRSPHRTAFWKRFVGPAVFGLTLLGLLPASPSAEQVVTNGSDSGAGSLRDIVALASPGETIAFAPGVTAVTLTSGEIAIAKNLTIQGSGIGGVVVQRDGSAPTFRLFHILNGASVTLRGLTIRNGRALEGGGIRSVNSHLTVEDCVVADNETTGSGDQLGGGILAMSHNGTATLVVRRSIVRDNSSVAGGGIYHWAHGGTASLTVTDSTFASNLGTAWAGAIFHNSNASATATMVVEGTTFSNHEGPGPAVVTFCPAGNLATASFTNTTVSGNSGGGLFVYGQVGGVVSQSLRHVTVLDSTIGTIAAPDATASTTYDRSVFAFADDSVASYFVIGGAGSLSVTSGGFNVSKRDLPGAVATPSVCTSSGTNGATIGLVAAGTCTVQADQAGNANYNAATPVARSFMVQ